MIAFGRRHFPRLAPRRAFTLVEVMISVALVLILIIGINQAFKMVTDTVGIGQAMSAISRDNRAIQPVLYGDLRAAVTQNPPAFIIAASRVNGFRNRVDAAGDLDAAPLSIDLDNNNTEGEAPNIVLGERISPANYNYRSHRTDRLAFFARDQFRRQTGNDGQYTNTMTGGEAYIWYGHLRLRNNALVVAADDNNYVGPGVGDFLTNPNNFYAANFALGRMVMMLRADEDPTAGASVIRDNTVPTPVAQEHIFEVAAQPAGRLSPLTWGSPATDGTHFVQESRYDLAATTIADFYADVLAVSGQPHALPIVPTAEGHWWMRLLYTAPYATAPAANDPPFPRERDYRFAANRFFARPLDAAKAARVAPILANGCTQFIVEFAGDYVTQTQQPGGTDDGEITLAVPDGVLDFIVDNTYGTRERRTRWYGMPRDTAGNLGRNGADQFVGGADGTIPIAGGTNLAGPDVLPVRDVRAQAAAPFTPPVGYVSFERNIANELPVPPGDDYRDVTDPANPGMSPDARYTCVWGPDVNPATDPLPQQLRITIVLDEPAGRMADGQTYEYVIDLP